MGPEGSLPRSQKSYSITSWARWIHSTTCFSKIYFHIILRCRPIHTCPNRFLALRYFEKNVAHISHLPMHPTCPNHSFLIAVVFHITVMPMWATHLHPQFSLPKELRRHSSRSGHEEYVPGAMTIWPATSHGYCLHCCWGLRTLTSYSTAVKQLRF